MIKFVIRLKTGFYAGTRPIKETVKYSEYEYNKKKKRKELKTTIKLVPTAHYVPYFTDEIDNAKSFKTEKLAKEKILVLSNFFNISEREFKIESKHINS